MTRDFSRIIFALIVAAGLGVTRAVSAAPAAPAPDASKSRDAIKAQKYEVQPVPYRSESRDDPFDPKVPLKTVQSRDRWKVRIGGLRLSSVVTGRKRVALFTETFGPSFAYILVNNVLIGPDHRAIPGIAGIIEPLGNTGNFKVTLRQGTEKVEHTFIKLDEDMRARAAEMRLHKDREQVSQGGVRDGSGLTDRYPCRGGDQ